MVGMNESLSFNPGAFFLERSAQPDSPEGEFVDKILRGELSAVEAYDQVLMNFSTESPRHLEILKHIRNEHELACMQVRQMVREEGREPSEASGPWGTLVTAAMSAATFLGEDGALRLLKSGEEHGLDLYREALQLSLLPSEKRLIQDQLIPKQTQHIHELGELLAEIHARH